ncbi:acetyltransferase [Muriicola marianensis]|nr:acetyltransferase [Muriicola marianensis]
METKTKKNQIIIYGAGGHSQVIRSVLELSDCSVSQMYDDKKSGWHHAATDVNPGIRENLDNFPVTDAPVIIAIGNNLERSEIAGMMEGSNFINAVHPSVIVDKTSVLGAGTVAFAGVIVQANTRVGKHVILNTGASVDHDNVIGDYAHISPKAVLCGHVEIGEGTHVGAGAIVIPSVKIGKWCTIGAGAVIIRDVPDYCTVVGNPGRVIKTGKHR